MNKQGLHYRLPHRMLWFGFLMIVCLLTFCASLSAAVPTQPAAKDPIRTLTQEIEGLRKELKIPGLSVAVLQGQQVVFVHGFGYADMKNKIPATANTPYNIASCTKPFAAAVLMKLVEWGELDLDDEMADILKDTVSPSRDDTIRGYASACQRIKEMSKDTSFPFAFLFQDYRCDTERITVRHHLTHTSQGKPGEAYQYNGSLYGLLSHVAEEVSGKSFAELLVENIIGPLEMTRTFPSISDSHCGQVLAERAKYYRVGDRGNFVLSEWPPKEIVKALKAGGLDSTTRLNAGGGMISTVLDLAKFDIAMDRNLIVSEESKEAMFTPTISNRGQPLPYGLGWFVQEHEGVKIVWHYGWAPDAYSSLILKVPQEEVTLILLANSDGASAPFRLGAGNVLTSPFAIMFINLFTKLKVKLSGIPIKGVIRHVHEPDHSFKTYIDIVIGKGFTGNLPDDLDTITVTGPKSHLPIGKDVFVYIPQLRDFFVRIPGSPEIGTYTFTVKGGDISGSAKDTQFALRTIPIPDTSTFSPAKWETLTSNTPTFSWGAVKAGEPIYYRLEINKLHGGRVYSTGYVKGMFSHTVPDGVLKPGQAYRWRVRVADGDNWIKVQNRSHSEWRSFTMAKSFEYVYQAPEKTDDGWETDSLNKMNVDSGKINELMCNIANGNFENIDSVVLVKNGKLILEEYFNGYHREKTHEIRSATKSIGSILTGIAIDHRFITDENNRIYPYFQKHEPDEKWDDKIKNVSLKTLLTMTSGFDCDDHKIPGFECERNMYKTNDWVEYALNLPMAYQPGEHWAYNSSSLILVSEIISETSKMSIPDFANKYLFEPLGITDFQWGFSPKGRAFIAGNAKMKPRDMAKIGYMFLNDGKWKGKQIISKEWIEESTRAHTTADTSEKYGYLWWSGKTVINNQYIEGYWAEGNGGQYIFVFPTLDLVAVFTGGNYNNPLSVQPMGMLINYIIPAMLPPGPPRKTIKLDPKVVDAYGAVYKFRQHIVTIFREGDKLYGQALGEKVELFPETENQFFGTSKVGGYIQINIVKDKNGEVKHVIVHFGFMTMQFDKIK